MGIYTKTRDKIIGNKILCEGRNISKVRTINKTNRHKAQRTILRDNAECVIMKEINYL